MKIKLIEGNTKLNVNGMIPGTIFTCEYGNKICGPYIKSDDSYISGNCRCFHLGSNRTELVFGEHPVKEILGRFSIED
jgi:hypothetical protein